MSLRHVRFSRAASTALVLLAAVPLLAARGCEEPGDPGACYCTREYAPVCGADGTTYSNACLADCSGAPIAHDGECGETCVCPAIYAPVCGTDGRTYGNSCEAACAGQMAVHEGECETACACPEIYAPVCGQDGRTYGNECEASCAGVMVGSAGPCECAAPPIHCEWGYEIDDRGCPTATCLPGPTCEPVLCDVWCEHGHVVDERGCETCACNAPPEPPVICASDADCAAGQLCEMPCAFFAPPGDELPPECLGVCVTPEPPPPCDEPR